MIKSIKQILESITPKNYIGKEKIFKSCKIENSFDSENDCTKPKKMKLPPILKRDKKKFEKYLTNFGLFIEF